MCRAVGIDGWIRSLPERLDTLVQERGGRLSAGERQLVALGRAFLADPAVIVLDYGLPDLNAAQVIERLLAPGQDGLAAELVAALRRMGAEDISVGCYPEVHPESPSSQADLDHLKRKLDAGADRAISQFFFEVEDFLRFRDRAVRAGITKPLVPGVVPVHDFNKVKSFATRCGASVPDWVGERFAGLEDDPETRGQVGAVIAADICRALRAEGIEEFHFYTLNRAPMTLAICRLLGIRPELQEAA